jgi:hypothetical protein
MRIRHGHVLSADPLEAAGPDELSPAVTFRYGFLGDDRMRDLGSCS